jgi:branched-chain amino acid transport system permease protein
MGYFGTILGLIGIETILALSVFLVFLTGQLSLGQAAFFGIGAYSSAILTMLYGVPFIPAIVAGGVVSFVCGIILGIPVLRLKGLVLAIATLGFNQMVNAFFLNWEWTKKIDGNIIGPKAGTGFRYIDSLTTHAHIFFWLGLFVLFLYLLQRSRFGYAMVSIRENENAAKSVGINVTGLKVAAFSMSAFMAGVAGGLYSHFLTFIHPLDFGFHLSVVALAYVAIGGIETLLGALLGAVFLIGMAESIRFVGEYRLMLYGIVMVVVMILRPRGLIDKDLTMRIKSLFAAIRGSKAEV